MLLGQKFKTHLYGPGHGDPGPLKSREGSISDQRSPHLSRNSSGPKSTQLAALHKKFATKKSYFVSGTSHIVDPSVRKTALNKSHPLAKLDLNPEDISMIKPFVYGPQYDLQKDPCPFYAPWNPPKLRSAEVDAPSIPSDTESENSVPLIAKFKEALDNPKRNPKNRSMFDCSNIRFTFDQILNSNEIGTVPLPDIQNLTGENSKHEALNASTSKKVVLKPLDYKIETLYKPFRKSRFPDCPPHSLPFFVLQGKPILRAPLSFLGNTFMSAKKLLAQNADNPAYKQLGIRRYEVNMQGFRDEQITFEICEKKVTVIGRKPPSPKSTARREVIEVFHLASFLNMNRMKIYRTKEGQIIFEEKWKEDESSEEESNPTRKKIKKHSQNYQHL